LRDFKYVLSKVEKVKLFVKPEDKEEPHSLPLHYCEYNRNPIIYHEWLKFVIYASLSVSLSVYLSVYLPPPPPTHLSLSPHS
jgi:hypothetical protein